MICRRDHLALLIAATLALLSCGPAEQRPTPLERARENLAAGEAYEAEILLDRLIADGADRTTLAAYLGEAALAQGNLARARDWLSDESFSQDTRGLGYRMLGRLAIAQGDLVEAGRAFDRALGVIPSDPDLWVDIGRLRYLGGEQFQALEASERAIQADPQNTAALLFRGQLARDSQGPMVGVSWFARAVEVRPNNFPLRVEYAASLGDSGRAKDALRVLRGADGRAVSDPKGLFVQAVLAARAGDNLLARTLLQRSGLDRNGIPAALLLSSIIDLSAGNCASAAQSLDVLYAKQPDNGRVADLYAYALSCSGRDRELVDQFAKHATSDRGTPYLRTQVARSFEALDDRVSAARFLDMATKPADGLRVLPGSMPPHVNVVGGAPTGLEARDGIRSALADGQPTAALERAKAFARGYPDSSDAFGLLGDAQYAAGNKPAARDAYRHAATVRRPWPLVLRLAQSEPDQTAVRSLVEQFVRNNPANGEAAAVLADICAREGKWAEAAQLLDHAMKLGQARVPWIVAARSVASSKLGDKQGALDYALQAHALQPLNPIAVSTLIAALPPEDMATRHELEIKLRSLMRR